MLKSHYTEDLIEVGLDEVGRGCLSGPVVAAGVILPKGYQNEFFDDSKKLSKKKREELPEIIKRDAIAWAIKEVSPEEIDQINILNASIKAMHLCVDALDTNPEFLLVDGNKFHNYKELPHQCVVKGDSKYLSIAAASILAKTLHNLP